MLQGQRNELRIADQLNKTWQQALQTTRFDIRLQRVTYGKWRLLQQLMASEQHGILTQQQGITGLASGQCAVQCVGIGMMQTMQGAHVQ